MIIIKTIITLIKNIIFRLVTSRPDYNINSHLQEGSQDLVETTHNDENDHEIPPAADLVIFSNRESAGNCML